MAEKRKLKKQSKHFVEEKFKVVEYGTIDATQGTTIQKNSQEQIQLYKEKDRRVIVVPRLLSLYNRFLLPHDLYIDLDMLLYGDKEELQLQEYQKSLVNDYKRIDSVEWMPNCHLVKLNVSNYLPQLFDFSPLVERLESLQDANIYQRVPYFLKYQEQCLQELEFFKALKSASSEYKLQRQSFIHSKKQKILQQFDFSKQTLLIFDKSLDENTGVSQTIGAYYSEKMIEFLGVFHCLDLASMKREELSSMLMKLGILHLFRRSQQFEFLFNFYISNNQGSEKGVYELEQIYEFKSIDDISMQCRGKRTQYNLNIEFDQQIHSSLVVASDYLSVYELFIDESEFESLRNFRANSLLQNNFLKESSQN